jgi:hypothetical protein
LLAPMRMHISNPPLPGIIETRIRHHDLLSRLTPHHIVIHPDLHCVAPQALIHIEAKVMEPHLAILPDGTRELAKASGPPQAHQVEDPALGLPQHDLWGARIDAALGILACMRPMAPKLIIPHTLGVPVIHLLALGTPHDRGIEHAALDGTATFRPIVPGMALRGRRPLESQLAETGGSRHTHRPMITDDGLRGAPLRERVPKDVEDTRDIVPLEAARSDDRATIPINNQHTLEPLPGNLDERPESDTPDLMRRRRRLGALSGVRNTWLPGRSRMRLLVQGDHLPDGGMARAIA